MLEMGSCMREWGFVTNHALVLSCIVRHPRSTAREMATEAGITERTAYKIVADLVKAEYLTRRKVGRRNIYTLNPALTASHPNQRDRAAQELASVLSLYRRVESAREAAAASARVRREEPELVGSRR